MNLMAYQFNSGFTAVPNLILDSCTKLFTPAEFMILMVIIRKTIGWHKSVDTISLSQFMKYTNLSRNTCIKVLKKLTEDGFIKGLSVNRNGTIYRLEPIEKIQMIVDSKIRDSQSDEHKVHDIDDAICGLVNNVNPTSSFIGPLPVQELDTYKETQINYKNKINNKEESLLELLTIPTNVSSEKLSQFIEMRKSKNNPLSLFGAQNLLEKLNNYGDDANEALSNAIIGNHDNVIAVKKRSKDGKSEKNSTAKKFSPRSFDK